jgi:predicted N-acetyltransferase YhbS
MQTPNAKDSDFKRAVILINQVFPGAKNMISQARELGANWQDASSPFVIEKKGNLIAHLGIVPLTLAFANQTKRVAALHAICVKKEYRRQGYFKQLMKDALETIQLHFDSSILFTEDPHFYEPYGYKIVPQYDFSVTVNSEGESSDLRPFYLQNPEDLALLKGLYANRVDLFNTFWLQHETLFILNSLDMKLFYSKQLDAILIFKGHNFRYLEDIVSSTPITLQDIVNVLPKCDELIFQFCPGEFLSLPYQVIPAKTKGKFMASTSFQQPCSPFRWNEMSRV